ncbi:MAG: PilN domain-containing protein [Pseudomonas sp.]|uniref:PilN domain-containing protein n=1 Tax=Pseudomonas sp. TaxID=306 RepID=UPI003398E07C
MRFDAGNLKLFGLDLGQLLRWWSRGLKESFPAGLTAAFFKPAPRVQAVVDASFLRLYRGGGTMREVARLDVEVLALTGDAALRADVLGDQVAKAEWVQVELLIPAAQVLRKQVTLPREVRNELREVVGYQVGRLTPFSMDKLYYDARICSDDKSAGQMEVELAAVPKAYVDPWVQQVERLTGLKVSRLAVVDDASGLNLFGQPRVSGRWWRRLNLNSWLLLCVLLAFATAIVAPLYKQRLMVFERKQQIAVLQGEVAGLLTTQQQLDKSLAALTFVIDARGKTPAVSAVLAEMSKIVPTNIYMIDLRILGDTLTMSGYGTEVVELIQLINKSPLFEEARFTSPVSRNPRTGQDQFTVSTRLAPPGKSQ